MTSHAISQQLRRALLAAFVLACASGCALVVRGTQQNIKVDAVSSDGKAIDALECRPAGDLAALPSTPQLTVRRSINDLLIQCISQGQVVASAKVISRADMALVSLVVGGFMSATIDQLSGAAYAYPGAITLVTGEERIYDRWDSSDGPYMGAFARRLGAAAPTSVVVLPAGSLASYYRASFKVTESQLVRPGARRTGRETYVAEKFAVAMNCSATPRAVLVDKGPGFETHQVRCGSGSELSIRCEFGNCRLAPPALLQAQAAGPGVQTSALAVAIGLPK